MRESPGAFAGGSASNGTQKGVFSFLRFFQTAERRYASLYETLWPAPSLDADKLHDMVVFAFRIEEPAQAAMWAKRLVREHPEDPRALYDLANVLHEVELQQPEGFADSIRIWIPLLDSLYHRAPQPLTHSNVFSLVQRYGDSATKQLWLDRVRSLDARYAVDVQSDPGIRALSPAVVEQVRVEATRDCTRPAGQFLFFGATSSAMRWCMLERANAMGTLAHVALVRGDARGAAALADSSMALRQQGVRCFHGWGTARRVAARARLALGDTAGAEHQLMLGIPPANQDSTFNEFARAALGARFDAVRWNTARDKAHESYRACQRQANTDSEAERAKRNARATL